MSSTKKKLLEETRNFADSVPQTIRDKLYTLAVAVQDNFISDQGESIGTSRLDAIYGYAYDGYIPFQLGGYEVSEFYHNDVDPSYHFTEAQTDYNNKSLENCYKSFAFDHSFEDDFTIDCLSPEMQDAFYEYEYDWFEPALLRFELWVKDLSTVELQLGINYKDAPYYRTKYDDTLFTLSLPIKDIMQINSEDFIKLLEGKL